MILKPTMQNNWKKQNTATPTQIPLDSQKKQKSLLVK